MSKEKLAVGNVGEEEVARVHRVVMTREETRAQTDDLFENAKKSREDGRKTVNKLFLQAPASITMAPILQKEKVAAALANDMEKLAQIETIEMAPRVLAFFEKKAYLTEAQRRFPELLKVAGTTEPTVPALKKKPASATPISGPTPTQSGLSGGAA